MSASAEHKPPLSIEAVYRAHGHVVLRRAQSILGNEHEAVEVLQDIFLGLLRDPSRFEGRSAVTTWLYRVTTNVCLNRIRDRKNRQRLLDERVAPTMSEGHQACSHHWASARQLIDRMPEELAQVTVYYAIDGMTHQEIAEVLGCSRRHVGNLLKRAQDWVQSMEEAK